MRTIHLLTWYHCSSGESNGMDGQCHHNIPFKEALALCVNAGARLCTLDELLGDETSSTVSHHDVAGRSGLHSSKGASNIVDRDAA